MSMDPEARALLELEQLLEVLSERLNLCAVDVSFVSAQIRKLSEFHVYDDGPVIEPPPPFYEDHS